MKVKSEQELLQQLLRRENLPESIIVGNGDDAAVFRAGGELLAFTTDTFVEGLDFRREFSTPWQIGWRVVEAAASDVVAMGGKPKYCVIALNAPSDTDETFLRSLYQGIYRSLDRLGALLLGGDTSAGVGELSLTLTIIGTLRNMESLCTRSGAAPGDFLYVSGPVGGAAAGLAALKAGLPGFEDLKNRHRLPRCRVDLIDEISTYATAMIDISDGLAHEIHLLCRASNVGCTVAHSTIPLASGIEAVAHEVGANHYDWAFGGGEDFELLYTVKAQDEGKVPGIKIGVINEALDIMLEREGKLSELPFLGYDHLKEHASGIAR